MEPRNTHQYRQQKPRRPRQRRSRDNFLHRALVVMGLLIAAVILIWLVWITRRVWLMCFAGVLLGILLSRLGSLVSRGTGMSYRWSLAVVAVGLVGLLGGGAWLMAKPLSEQVSQLSQELPKAVEKIRTQVNESQWTERVPQQLKEGMDLSKVGEGALGHLTRVFSGTFEAIGSVLLVLFLAGYLAASPQTYADGITRLFPVGLRPRVRQRLRELQDTLWHWLIGQLIAMAVVGITVGIGLAIIGVPMPLALGVLAGLLEFIPYFGPLIAGTPAFLLAFTLSPMHALYVVALIVGVNFVEGHFLLPLVNRYSVELPPAVTLLALVVMGTLFGFLGLLLATPIAAALFLIVRREYVETLETEREEP